MKKAVEVILILLYFLEGANDQSGITLALLLLLLAAPFIGTYHKIRLPDYFLLAAMVYAFYLALGLYHQHPAAHIDIKFQFFQFIFFLALVNQRVKIDFLGLLFKINLIVFISYLILLLDLFPNFWHESTFGRQGRVLGPNIICIALILFYYLYKGRPFDRRLGWALLYATVYLLLTSNFMNIAIVLSLVALIVVNFKKLFRPVYIITLIAFIVLGILYLRSPWVPDMVATKMEYALKPWEYGTVQTRIQDLQQALGNENFGWFEKIIGKGFGTGSKIYRENKISPSLSRTLAFQEIDNGFYYLYHRGGWSLLSIFIISHIYLMFKIKRVEAKLGFVALVFITNILSIHYFNYYFYLLIPFFIIYRDSISDSLNRI